MPGRLHDAQPITWSSKGGQHHIRNSQIVRQCLLSTDALQATQVPPEQLQRSSCKIIPWHAFPCVYSMPSFQNSLVSHPASPRMNPLHTHMSETPPPSVPGLGAAVGGCASRQDAALCPGSLLSHSHLLEHVAARVDVETASAWGLVRKRQGSTGQQQPSDMDVVVVQAIICQQRLTRPLLTGLHANASTIITHKDPALEENSCWEAE